MKPDAVSGSAAWLYGHFSHAAAQVTRTGRHAIGSRIRCRAAISAQSGKLLRIKILPDRAVKAVLSCLLGLWSGTGTAAQPLLRPALHPDPAALCDLAAQSASVDHGVPLPVLAALMLTESGRNQGKRLRPWPWTINMEGAGHWFDSQADARAFVDTHFRRGARSFDIGCFQVNYKWHHQGFASIDEMFEPLANASYAARFLRELFVELGSWDKAAGAYHSRTPELAERYRARFLKHHARITSDTAATDLSVPVLMAESPVSAPPGRAPRDRVAANTYPLLQAGPGGMMGSLVPTGLFRAQPLLATGPGGLIR